MIRPLIASLALAAIACSSSGTIAQVPSDPGEWPQWRGPNRDGLSTETGLADSWPEGGPPLVWQIEGAGTGHSSVAIADGRLYTMGNRDGRTVVIAYELPDTGGTPVPLPVELWATENGAAYSVDGAGSTPTVDGDRVYALSGHGDLCCLDAATGDEHWSLNILEEFDASNIGWGISESVLIDGDRVICAPGGREATIVALDKYTGETIWTSTELSDPAGHASCIIAELGDIRQIITFTDRGVVAVDARDGRFLWRDDRAANSTANVATPIFHNSAVFSTSAYGTGCALTRLTARGSDIEAEEDYFNGDMQNHHGGVVLVDGYLYGFSGNALTCMDFETGEVMWRDRATGKGSLVYADGMLFCLGENHEVGLVEATPEEYRELGYFELEPRSGHRSWAHPVVAGGRMYLRDQDVIYCYDVSE